MFEMQSLLHVKEEMCKCYYLHKRRNGTEEMSLLKNLSSTEGLFSGLTAVLTFVTAFRNRTKERFKLWPV